jgi:hypothetical protein
LKAVCLRQRQPERPAPNLGTGIIFA